MYISLSSYHAGHACAIRDSIRIYGNNGDIDPNQFFDWLTVSMKSVNEVIEMKPIEFEDHYIYPNVLGQTTVFFKGFDSLISHHEVHVMNENGINELVEKYTRKRARLINTIKTQTRIYFLRYCKNQEDLEEAEIFRFINNIANVNPDLNFKFILMSDHEDLFIPPGLRTLLHFFYIPLHEFLDDDTIKETKEYTKNIKMYKCVFNLMPLDP